jgi:hypothetical protein
MLARSTGGERVDSNVFRDGDDVELSEVASSTALVDWAAQRESREEGDDKSEGVHLVGLGIESGN